WAMKMFLRAVPMMIVIGLLSALGVLANAPAARADDTVPPDVAAVFRDDALPFITASGRGDLPGATAIGDAHAINTWTVDFLSGSDTATPYEA
ncbi:hypothetical protein ACC691_38635, partial [Rhizobium johnstonii]|uniref:hypothetical protein n=1 Tax=Rhizobium johnstonii TaxID=3019933 RepID=UPI003F9933BE